MSSTQYRADIDGLRAIAVVAVVINHIAPAWITGGYVGVDVFFVISGYLITRIVRTEALEGRFTFTRFYERRVKRLYPALIGCLISVLVAAHIFLLPSDYGATLRATLATCAFSSNLTFWHELSAGYFAADAKLNPLLHTWSLAVEEQFYLLYPVALVACLRVAPTRAFQLLAIVALSSLAASAALVYDYPTAAFFLLPFRAWELLVGALLAFDVVRPVRSGRARDIVSAIGLGAIVGPILLYREDTVFPGLAALAPTLGAAALIHAGSNGVGRVQRLLACRPAVYLGLISYSLYLWHWPLVVFVRYRAGMQPLGLYALALIPASLVLGSLSYHLVEQKWRRAKATPRATFAAAVAASMFLAAWSSFALVQDAFPERLSPAAVAYDQVRRQTVPYVDCDERAGGDPERWCRLGSADAATTVLVWGDSHVLQWAPALDEILRAQGLQAAFVPNSQCPPILGLAPDADRACEAENYRVRDYLVQTPGIEVVIAAGYWNAHLRSDAANADLLAATFRWLASRNLRVAVIGQTPLYGADVPLALALGEAFSTHHGLDTSSVVQRSNAAAFWEVADLRRYPNVDFIDPMAWFCASECVVESGGVPLHRDRHHLSAAGAQSVRAQLAAALSAVLR